MSVEVVREDIHCYNIIVFTKMITEHHDNAIKRTIKSQTCCPHHHCSSSKAYITKLQSLALKINLSVIDNTKLEAESEEFLEKTSSLLCQQCALYVVSNLPRIIAKNKRYSTEFAKQSLGNKSNNGTDRKLLPFYPGIKIDAFANCLNYREFATVLFRHNHLWMNVFYTLDRHLAIILTLSQRRVVDYESRIALLLFEIIRNIKLMKSCHWQKLWNIYPKINCSLFQRWVGFIQKLSENIISMDTLAIIYGLLVLITTGLQKMIEYGFEDRKKQFNIKKIIKSLPPFDPEMSDTDFQKLIVPYSLKMLLNEQNIDRSYITIDELGKGVWHDKWMRMRCQNAGCDKQRLDDKLYKCKKCRVVRYCSRRCQKVDWNQHNHKLYCKKIRALTKESRKNSTDKLDK